MPNIRPVSPQNGWPRATSREDQLGASGRVPFIITGGLRTHTDFAKALALGANGVVVSNSAMQAIGGVGARICNTNLCPAGIEWSGFDPDRQI